MGREFSVVLEPTPPVRYRCSARGERIRRGGHVIVACAGPTCRRAPLAGASCVHDALAQLLIRIAVMIVVEAYLSPVSPALLTTRGSLLRRPR